ncbi:hypothetical protein PIB30_118108 [Stylosanthes scabra]|uniref:Uncharacterized protein n=1 Tax=Stylosanthes scabra TaxID=79078 RepID=A0ABU6VKN3_9FABA|nr:hypothetical protein [Stylosanthes scabra]
MVSEASRNMQDLSTQHSKRLQQEMLNIQQVSKDATKEVCEYVENSKCHFVEQICSANVSKSSMENSLLDCSKKVECSKLQWESAHMSLNNIHKDSLVKIESTVKDNIIKNNALHQEYVSASLALDSDYTVRTRNLLMDVNGALMLDHETKREIDCMTKQWLEQLNSVQQKHDESISKICVQADKSLVKDYLVDKNKSPKSHKRNVTVPSHASIEEMRSQITESKIPRTFASPNRTPFSNVN